MKLKIGSKYWVLTNSMNFQKIGKNTFESLKYLVCMNIVVRMDDGQRFYFAESENDRNYIIIDEWNVKKNVFKSQDAYLHYMVQTIDRTKYEFDDFFKNKILESQQENPCAWI